MQYWESSRLRSAFLNYFEGRGHLLVPPASLVPQADPTLLFTNAGMNPFKPYFLGLQAPPGPCLVSCQPCLRAGGKHNDLENVGTSARHHTLFEMLGNFSFGDLQGSKAISLAWNFLVGPEGLGLPPSRLWVTVYEGDRETAEVWLSLEGVSRDRLVFVGDDPEHPGQSDNFWQMGDVGPCGPCTEVFYDYGPNYEGTPPGIGHQGNRFVEIWNLVFMRNRRGPNRALFDLPKSCLDTGMGLERMAAVLQGTQDTYRTDIFAPIFQALAQRFGLKPPLALQTSFRIVADHLRAAAAALHAGVTPSNQGRGYVLRRLIRRAVLHARRSVSNAPSLAPLLTFVLGQLNWVSASEAEEQRCFEAFAAEEEAFCSRLGHGLQRFQTALSKLTSGSHFPGEEAFRLYDTYGFPVELTKELCLEAGYALDQEGFERSMGVQRAQSKRKSAFGTGEGGLEALVSAQGWSASEFLRDHELERFPAKPLGWILCQKETFVKEVLQGQEAWLFLEATPFYPEGGGQQGDQGSLTQGASKGLILDTKRFGTQIGHRIRVLEGVFRDSEPVVCQLDWEIRKGAAQHHTAAHLLHAALRAQFGPSIKPAGSSVSAQGLRLDVSFSRPFAEGELDLLTNQVNRWVQDAMVVSCEELSLECAKSRGALAFFEDKYGDRVRMVSVGEVSRELCGGTHVKNSQDVLYFRIDSSATLAHGVRRIEARAGQAALQAAEADFRLIRQASRALQAPACRLLEAVEARIKRGEELEVARAGWERLWLQEWTTRYTPPAHAVALLCAQVPSSCSGSLRRAANLLLQKGWKGVALLGRSPNEASVQVCLAIQKEASKRLGVQANRIVARLLETAPGKGGGNEVLAQAKLDCVLEQQQKLQKHVLGEEFGFQVF